MRLARLAGLALAPIALAGCNIDFTGIGGSDPTNLEYTIVSGGTGSGPAGILLTWDAPTARRTTSFAVYGRPYTSGGWYLIGTTTSTSFHDNGEPQQQYYVAARDDDDYEFGRSNTVTIDLGDRLPAPQGLGTTPVVNGVQLRWNANAATYGGSWFANYRVYSTRFDTARNTCQRDAWVMEGTTISEQFLVSGLSAGAIRCFAVSAVNRGGLESAWSEVVIDAAR
jgi:hypothetical protein